MRKLRTLPLLFAALIWVTMFTDYGINITHPEVYQNPILSLSPYVIEIVLGCAGIAATWIIYWRLARGANGSGRKLWRTLAITYTVATVIGILGVISWIYAAGPGPVINVFGVLANWNGFGVAFLCGLAYWRRIPAPSRHHES